jgi:spore coat polysaccharide biosynthesis protein SpsF
MSSSRLPGKVLKEINGMPMIYWQLKRISQAKSVNKIVVATSTDDSDNPLVEFLVSQEVDFVRGSLNNVKERFDLVLRKFPSASFIRLTGDCPLVMPALIDDLAEKFDETGVDYLSNTINPTYPDGLDIEVVATQAFNRLGTNGLTKAEMEHVTYGLYSRVGEFRVQNFENPKDMSELRWTVDYEEDLDFVRQVFGHFKGRETTFTYAELLGHLRDNPELKSRIDGSRRNESLISMLKEEDSLDE